MRRLIAFILAFLTLFVAYMGFYINRSWQPFNVNQLFRHETCVYLSTPQGQIEELTFTSEGIAIGTLDDMMTLNTKGPKHTRRGGFVAVTPEPFNYEQLEITDFPTEIALHPHGIFLHQDRWLYAINNAYDKGGQRVEVFELIKTPKLSLKYHKTYHFADEYMATINDLVIFQEGELYVTQFLHRPHKITGSDFGLFTELLLLFEWTLLNPTNLLRCDVSQMYANCTSVLKGHMINGITTDGTHLFVNDLFDRVVIRLNRLANGELVELDRIEMPFAINNIDYDKTSGNIYGGGLASIFGYMQFEFFGTKPNPSGAIEIKKENGKWEAEKLAVIDGFYSLSTTTRWKNYILLGPDKETSIGRC